MSDLVVDSSVIVKWILPEADSSQALRLLTDVAAAGGHIIVLDLLFPEAANAIWKRFRRKLITLDEAKGCLTDLERIPVHVEPAMRLIGPAFDIAAACDRTVYDALFIALARDLGLKGVTADEPLHNSTHTSFPQIILLRDWP